MDKESTVKYALDKVVSDIKSLLQFAANIEDIKYPDEAVDGSIFKWEIIRRILSLLRTESLEDCCCCKYFDCEEDDCPVYDTCDFASNIRAILADAEEHTEMVKEKLVKDKEVM